MRDDNRRVPTLPGAHAMRRDARRDARYGRDNTRAASRFAFGTTRARRRLAATFSDGQLRDLQLALSLSHRSFSPSLARHRQE